MHESRRNSQIAHSTHQQNNENKNLTKILQIPYAEISSKGRNEVFGNYKCDTFQLFVPGRLIKIFCHRFYKSCE